MKRISNLIFIFFTLLLITTSCKEDEATILTGDAISPVIKYVSMPSQSSTIPGRNVYINGVGFSSEDSISCRSLEEEADFAAPVMSADNYGIKIFVPEIAGGEYEVSVTRNNLTTVLGEHLFVAFVFTIDNLSVPASAESGEDLVITGEGFMNGDQVLFESDYYPQGISYVAETDMATDGVSFTVPDGCYGMNNITLLRGKKTCNMGTINIPVNVGDQIGGGVVFYTSDNGVHGLIAAQENVVNEQVFGPSIQVDPYASGVSEDIFTGKNNTDILIDGIALWRAAGNSAEPTVAELCGQYSVEINGIIYNDWFLGSLNEMTELFNYRATLANAYEFVSAQNYWTSSVIPGSNWAWAYHYVNFWESETLITGAAPCDVWAIAARPIRQF